MSACVDIEPPPYEDKIMAGELFIQLVNSIRKLDGSISSLSYILKNNLCKEEYRPSVRTLVERHVETRFCLVYSMLDVKPAMVRYFDKDALSEHKCVLDDDIYEMIKRL